MATHSTASSDSSNVLVPTIAYGRRLLPQVVEDWALEEPHKIHSYIAVSNDAGYVFKPFTYSMLAHTVRVTVRWLERVFHDQDSPTRTVAFLGNNDIRSIIFFLAGIQTGAKILLLNVYTTAEASRESMEANDCQILVFVEETRQFIPDGVSAISLNTLDEMLEANESHEFPYKIGSFEDKKDSVVAILQTSGSTGKPKVVRITNGKLAVLDAYQSVGLQKGCSISAGVNCHGARCKYIALDLAYNGGIEYGITGPIFEGTPIVLGPTQLVPHDLKAEEFCEIMTLSKADSILAYPSVFERIVENQKAYSHLASLSDAAFLGGPLSTSVIRKIAAQCPLNHHIGSTETGGFINYDLEFEDTASGYLWFDSTLNGITWEEVEEGLFEPVIMRKPELTHFQAVFHSFPERNEWRMGDLYSKHPDPMKSDVWKFERRRDDAIMLSHGEKVSGVLWEAALRELPFVEAAIIIGQGRSEIGAIIQTAGCEPKHIETDSDCLKDKEKDQLERLWALLDRRNATLGELQRLDRKRVLFAAPNKPIARTAKGGISRKKTLELYEQEVERLYDSPMVG